MSATIGLKGGAGTSASIQVNSSDKLTIDTSGTVSILGTSIGTTSGAYSTAQSIQGNNGNVSYLETYNIRDAVGSDWNTAGTRVQQKVDATWMGWSQFNGSGNTGGISWGTGSSTASPTSITEKLRLDSSGYLTGLVAGNTSRGLYQGSMYYRLNSGIVGANSTAVQPIFGVGVTLASNTVYEFEYLATFQKTAGTTLHSLSTSFTGTATIDSIYAGVNLVTRSGAADDDITGETPVMSEIVAATSSVTKNIVGGNANTRILLLVKGTVSIGTGGTFIPNYILSAAPGGAYTVKAGSYIKISPISASGANTNIGSWT